MKHQTDPDYLQQKAYSDAYDLNVRTHILKYYRAHSQSWYHWLYNQLVLSENGRILELGCGPGDLWQHKEQGLAPAGQLCLSDLSAGMVQEARQHLQGHIASCFFAVLEAGALPFAASTFDAVLAFGLLDHLPNGRQALAEVQRVLRPGGTFYTSTGGHTHLQEIKNLTRPFFPEAGYGGDPDRFGLQNGARVLTPFFPEVEQRPYENNLIFQEEEPLLAYVLSEAEVRQQLSAAQLKAL